MNKRTLQAKINKYAKLSNQIADLTKQKEALTAELKEYMITESLDTLTTKQYKIKYSSYERINFNSKIFKEEHPRMYDRYIYTTYTDRLTANLNK